MAHLPPHLSIQIQSEIKSSGFSSQKIAEAVLKLSDHYQNQDSTTPWENPLTSIAYLSYFLPLNIIRNQAVFEEMKQLQLLEDSPVEKVVDFGSGPGTSYFAASSLNSQNWDFIESSSEAQILFEKLNPKSEKIRWKKSLFAENITSPTLGVFSYSFNEIEKLPSWVMKLEHLILIEPSTQTAGRNLQELRSFLIEKGFSIWAPCLHQLSCPLTTFSKKDWCHHQIEWEAPNWFLEIEEHLPMKNQTLTYSYLIASKKAAPPKKENLFRMTGNLLKEKGKTRILACRGPDREFLSWMHKKHKEIPQLARGDLFETEISEQKGNELRI